jgi:hypothetical protein
MADLASKATDGRLSFTKYVTDNKRFLEIEYEIEKGRTASLFKKNGNGVVVGNKQYNAGTKLKITDSKLYEMSGMKLAAVKIGGEAGFVQIRDIRKPTGGNGTQYEDEVVDAINAYILKAGGTIDIRLKGDTKVYKNLAYCVKVDAAIKRAGGVKGDPKADIVICRDKTKIFGPDSIYISHKKEGGPEAFQQYGGISEQAGSDISNHPLVQKFLSHVASMHGDSQRLPAPVMGTFSDSTLSNMSIYGPDYGKAFSLQHTQIIGQGKPVFREATNYVELSFSSHMSLSGDLSHFTAGYLPVFGATFRAGRGFNYKGKRYSGARVGIYPHKLMATRGDLITVNLK